MSALKPCASVQVGVGLDWLASLTAAATILVIHDLMQQFFFGEQLDINIRTYILED